VERKGFFPWLLVEVTQRLFVMEIAEVRPGPVGEEWLVGMMPRAFGF
jgi:hypothetical protein